MAERRRRVWLALAVLACSACSGFLDFEDPKSDDPRLLDRACESEEGCKTEGNAELTTGITSDSVGVRLGPGGGSVVVPLVVAEGAGEAEVEVLAAGRGSLRVTSSALGVSKLFELRSDYAWYGVTGTASGDPALDLSVEGEDQAEIADIRAKGLDFPPSCAVSAPGAPSSPLLPFHSRERLEVLSIR